jgi:hypothetical protein
VRTQRCHSSLACCGLSAPADTPAARLYGGGLLAASAWRAARSPRAGACAGGGGDVELARPGAPERVPSFSKEGLKPLVGPAPARGWAGALRRLCRRAPAAEQAAHAGSAADPGPLGGRGAGGGVARRERRPNMPAAEAAAVAAFRAALERLASNSATAVSEWYLGVWHGRHWCARSPCLGRAAWLGGALSALTLVAPM